MFYCVWWPTCINNDIPASSKRLAASDSHSSLHFLVGDWLPDLCELCLAEERNVSFFFFFFFKLDQIFAHSIHIQKLKREAVEICRDEQTKPTLVQGQRGQIQQVCQCVVVVVVVQGVTFDAWYKNMITVRRSSDQMQWHWLHSVFQQEGQPHPVPVRWTVPLVQGSPPGAKDRSSQDVPQIPLLPLHRQQGFRSELVRHGPGCAQGLWRADAGRHVQWLRWA